MHEMRNHVRPPPTMTWPCDRNAFTFLARLLCRDFKHSNRQAQRGAKPRTGESWVVRNSNMRDESRRDANVVVTRCHPPASQPIRPCAVAFLLQNALGCVPFSRRILPLYGRHYPMHPPPKQGIDGSKWRREHSSRRVPKGRVLHYSDRYDKRQKNASPRTKSHPRTYDASHGRRVADAAGHPGRRAEFKQTCPVAHHAPGQDRREAVGHRGRLRRGSGVNSSHTDYRATQLAITQLARHTKNKNQRNQCAASGKTWFRRLRWVRTTRHRSHLVMSSGRRCCSIVSASHENVLGIDT